MSDFGLYYDRQTRDGLSYVRQLLGANWRRYELPGEQHLLCCDLPWTLDFDPYSIFDAVGETWRLLWRSRSDQTLRLAVGSALQLTNLQDSLLTMTGTESWFIAQPFAAHSPVGKEATIWQDLCCGFIIMPQIEWLLRPHGSASVTIRAVFSNDCDREQAELKFAEILRDHLPLILCKNSNQLARPIQVIEEPGYADWEELVSNAIGAIKARKLNKVVLSRNKILRFSQAFDWAPILFRLAQIDERSYFFAAKSPSGHGFIGRSPERLLAWDSSHFFIDAIAGTRQRSSVRSEDFDRASQLRTSSKDLREHRYVSDYVAEVLGRHGLAYETVESESLLRLQNVQHMRTRFRAYRSEQLSPLALLEELHPTPAIGGLPKEDATQFILENEAIERGLFSGSFGCVQGVQAGDLAIGIRSALFRPQEIRLYAGAGIVEDSKPDWEWQETDIKMKNFTDLFSD